jgi:hypothetical protein
LISRLGFNPAELVYIHGECGYAKYLPEHSIMFYQVPPKSMPFHRIPDLP